MVKAVLTKKRLTISVPLHEPKLSKTGKMFLVANTHGFKSSKAMLSGKRLRVNVTAGFLVQSDESGERSPKKILKRASRK